MAARLNSQAASAPELREAFGVRALQRRFRKQLFPRNKELRVRNSIKKILRCGSGLKGCEDFSKRYPDFVKRRRVFWLLPPLILLIGIALLGWRQFERDRRFDKEIRTAAKQYGVDPLLIRAVVWRESRFVPDIRGRAGEIGLMQIQDIAAREWADAEHLRSFDHEHCLDPGTNTLAGTFYLSKLLKRYQQTDDPVPYALADYNAGRSKALRWKTGTGSTNSHAFVEQITYPSTKNYIKSVTRRYRLYKLLAKAGL
jgi:soluble lytic murein transglycosylase